MAYWRTHRLATQFKTRSVLLMGAALSAAFCIAAIASPTPATLASTLPTNQTPSPTPQAAPAQLPPSITPRPAELLHDTGGTTPATAPASAAAQPAPKKTKQVWMTVTAYCPCTKCCGEDASGITASGRPVSYNHGKFVAADTDLLPFGTKVSIPGYHDGEPVKVIDRGGAIKGRHIDVYFNSHNTAKEWGTRKILVTVEVED